MVAKIKQDIIKPVLDFCFTFSKLTFLTRARTRSRKLLNLVFTPVEGKKQANCAIEQVIGAEHEEKIDIFVQQNRGKGHGEVEPITTD